MGWLQIYEIDLKDSASAEVNDFNSTQLWHHADLVKTEQSYGVNAMWEVKSKVNLITVLTTVIEINFAFDFPHGKVQLSWKNRLLNWPISTLNTI